MNGKPNILLIVIDCGRSDRLVGPGRHTITPNLDRLAREGICFPTTITEKSCTSPNFSSLLTGLYSPRHGVQYVFGCKLPETVPMLTRELSQRGYHTYAEVSGPLMETIGLARGFDEYEYRSPLDYLDTRWGELFIERLASGHYKSPWFLMLHVWELHTDRRVAPGFDTPRFGRDLYERAVSSLDAQLGRVLATVPDNTLVAVTADHGECSRQDAYRPGTAVDYTRKVLGIDEAQGLPFDAVGWMAGPGTMQEFERDFRERIKGVRLRDGLPRTTFTRWDRWADRLRLLWVLPFVWTHELLSLRSPVKLTAMLKRRGMLDEDRSRQRVQRLVRFVGKEKVFQMQVRMWINSYKSWLKEGHSVHVYDFLTKVPLVMRWPGRLPAGRVIDRMVRQVDIVPTILDLVGVDGQKSGEIEGQSLRPLIEGRPWESRPAFLSVSGVLEDLEIHGVRTEEFRYTYGPYNPEMPEELYDLRADPDEITNLAAAQPDRCRELRALAAGFVPADGATPMDLISIQPQDEQRIEKHLQELGYIE